MALIEERSKDLGKIIALLAGRFSERNPGLEFEDLVQEAWLLLYKIQDGYDSSRSSITTWAWNVVVNRFRELKARTARSKGSGLWDQLAVGEECLVDRLVGDEFFDRLCKMLSPVAGFVLARRLAKESYSEIAQGFHFSFRDLLRVKKEIRAAYHLLCSSGDLGDGQ